MYFFAGSRLGPQVLSLSALIVAYEPVRRFQNGGGAPVILFQPHHAGVWEILLEFQDVSYIGAPPSVDALVVIAAYTDVAVLLGHKGDYLILKTVGVLILIHQDVAETVLVVFQHLGHIQEHPVGVEQQVVEVHGVVFPELFLVSTVQGGDILRSVYLREFPQKIFRSHGVVLGHAYQAPQPVRINHFFRDACVSQALFGHGLRVRLVVYREGGLVPRIGGMYAKDPRAYRMEGAHPHVGCVWYIETLNPGTHLARCLVREGQSQDLVGPHTAVREQMGYPVDDRTGLAAAGSGQDKQGALSDLGGFALHWIQFV